VFGGLESDIWWKISLLPQHQYRIEGWVGEAGGRLVGPREGFAHPQFLDHHHGYLKLCRARRSHRAHNHDHDKAITMGYQKTDGQERE
jgi:hypothetical protein